MLFRVFEARQSFHVSQHKAVDEIVKPLRHFILVIIDDNGRNIVGQFALLCIADTGKEILLAVFFDILLFKAHSNEFIIQAGDLSVTGIYQRGAPRLRFVISISGVLEIENQPDAFGENHLGQRSCVAAFDAFFMLAEELKIAAIVKDVEAALSGVCSIFAINAVHRRAFSSATTNHLPEFALGAYLLEEYKVADMRNVNTCIHHINRYHNMRLFFCIQAILSRRRGLLKVINDGLSIGIVADNTLRKTSHPQLRIQSVETLDNVFGMSLVLCKDNRLCNAVAASYLDAVRHQILQNHINGLLVENELV